MFYQPSIKLFKNNDDCIEIVDKFKYLIGIVFDSSLSWKEHVKHVSLRGHNWMLLVHRP